MTDPTADPPAPPTLWRNGAFVRVWSAATISIFGSLVTRIALPFVAILVLGAGPIEVGLLRAAELGSALLVGLAAGAWVDRLRRRPVLIWADLGRAALLFSIPVAAIGGWLTLPQVLLVAALASVLTTFFDAADNAYLPTIVPRSDLLRANGALAASGSAAEFVAFGAAGFLVQILTAPIAILIDAVTFLVSAALLGTIRQAEAPPPPAADREPVLTEIRVGLRIVLGDPTVRALAGGAMALAALWGIFGATWLLFVTRELGLSPGTVGVVAALGGFASLIGAVAATRATRRFGVGTVMIAAMLLTALGNLAIPLAPAGIPIVAIACLAMQQLVGDGGVTVFDVTSRTLVQALVPDRHLGRVNATFRVGMVLAQLGATLAGGLFAEFLGLRTAAFLAPLGALAGAWILWASPVRHLRAMPAHEPVAANAP